MGSYVLYVLMQAIVALACAYTAGSLAIGERRWTNLLVAVGLYLVLGATLTEIWTDRFDWETGTLGLYIALISMGVLTIGVGFLVREMNDGEEDERVTLLPPVILIVGAVMAIVLALGSRSKGVVDPGADAMSGLAGGFSNLGPAGVVLALPMVVGAVLIVLTGARASLARGDTRGLWLWVAGILLVLWSLDIEVGQVPVNPAMLMFALVMTYFGFQPTREKVKKGREGETDEGSERPLGEGPVQTAMDEWLRMVEESEREMGEATEGDAAEPDERGA